MVQHLFKLDTRLALPFVRFEGPEIPIDVSQFCTMQSRISLAFCASPHSCLSFPHRMERNRHLHRVVSPRSGINGFLRSLLVSADSKGRLVIYFQMAAIKQAEINDPISGFPFLYHCWDIARLC